MRLLSDSRLWRGVAFLHSLQKGEEQVQGTHGKNECEPRRDVDVKVVNSRCSLRSYQWVPQTLRFSSCRRAPLLLHFCDLIAPTIGKLPASHREHPQTEQS